MSGHKKKSAKTLKVKSDFTEESVKNLHDAALINSELESDFGLFCVGACVAIRSIFPQLQKLGRYSNFNFDTPTMILSTLQLINAFEDTKRDLTMALIDNKDNAKVRDQIRELAEAMRK